MTVRLYFRNIHSGKRYEIVKLDKEAGVVTLKGEYAEFDEPYSKPRFEQLGYVLERENEESNDAVE